MKKILLAVLASAFAFGASAAELSFNNFGIGYTQADFSCSSDCDGFNLLGSLEINDLFSVNADYTNINASGGSSVDFTYLGLGVRSEFSDNAAFFGQVGAARIGIDTPFGDDSETKGFAGVGIRGMFSEQFEGEALVRKVFASDFDASLKLTGTYFFTDTVGASLNVETNDGDTGGGVGLRMNF